jgi:MFS family permease
MSRVQEGGLLDDGAARFVTGVSAFFATMYFIQGIGDPTSGLVAQPVRALLASWGESPSSIGAFMALLSLPWMLKPLFGLLSDFVPIFGTHRRHYLLFSSIAAAVGLFVLWAVPLPSDARWFLFVCLLLPTIGIAFGDVLVDALMIEVGQPRGLTGRLQSIQWTAVYAALILAGALGGWASDDGRHQWAFLLCGLVWIPSIALAWRFVREAPRPPGSEGFRHTADGLLGALRVPGMPTVIAMLFVWSFNPSWVTVQYVHVTQTLAMDEQTFGNSNAFFSVGCVIASVLYGLYCRRVPMGVLVHVAIVTGVIGYAAYLETSTPQRLYGAALVSGVANMTGVLIQLDIAARLVPVRVAATAFAALMAVTNISASLAEAVGSRAYEWLAADVGAVRAYQLVVLASAAIAATCWLLIPRLRLAVPAWWRS